MTASRLSIYQAAATVLGESKPVSLTENVSVRKDLDGVWDRDGVKTCLQAYLWNFATRAVEIEYSPSITPPFGYTYAFEKPDDFVRLVNISRDEYFRHPLNEFNDDGGYWTCDLTTIWVRYISSDTDYGFDYSKWPHNFTRFVECWFAYEVARRVTGSGRTKEDVAGDLKMWRDLARQTDAAEEPVTFAPQGSWSQARQGRRSERYRTR